MPDESFTLHGFWGLVELAWSQLNDSGVRADILATLHHRDDDLYSTTPNEEPDLELLRDAVDDLTAFLPCVHEVLLIIVQTLDDRQREGFYRSIEHVIGALDTWDGENNLKLTSDKVQCIRARCWVVSMGREIYHTLRSNPATHAYFDYVDNGHMYNLARDLYFEVADAKKPLKRRSM